MRYGTSIDIEQDFLDEGALASRRPYAADFVRVQVFAVCDRQWPTMQISAPSVLLSLLVVVLVCFAFLCVVFLCCIDVSHFHSRLFEFDWFGDYCILNDLLSLISGGGIEKRLVSLTLAFGE